MQLQSLQAILAVLLTLPVCAETVASGRVKPVCGNTENGIVVGKPRLFDDRTLSLLIESLEQQLTAVHDRTPGSPQETQLNFLLTNLRSLTGQSLSDRVLHTSPNSTQPRARILIGLQVSVDPKDRYANSLAEIEVTISSRGDHRQAPAVITLLPRDKTYNIATVSATPPAPGSAIAQHVTSADGKQSFFLLQDSDTVALERVKSTPEAVRGCSTGFEPGEKDLTMSWQFRPVLGRDRVEAGTRDVYAFLALPTTTDEEFQADIRVHTHWRPLKHQKRKGGADFLEDSAREELWAGAINFNPVEMEQLLRPRITGVRMTPSGPGEILVDVNGENFLSDTRVTIGDKSIIPPALQIEHERHLRFSVPPNLLTGNQALLTTGFGTAVPLVEPEALRKADDPSWGLKIEQARAHPKDAARSEVRIKLKSRMRKRPLPEMIVNRTLVEIAGRVIPVSTLDTEPTDSDAVLIRFEMPTAELRSGSRVTVARIFGGEAYRDTAELIHEDEISVTEARILSLSGDEVTFAIAGSGFSNLASVQVGEQTITRWTNPALVVNGPTMLTLKLKRSDLEGVKQLTLSQGFARPLMIPAPELPVAEASRTRETPASKARRRPQAKRPD